MSAAKLRRNQASQDISARTSTRGKNDPAVVWAIDIGGTPDDRILDVIPRWQRWLRGEGHQESTVLTYGRRMRRVAHWLDPDAACVHLEGVLIEAYRDEQMEVCEEKTVGLDLTIMRSFCLWCVRTKRLSADPTIGIRWPTLPRPRPRRLSSSELAMLHDALRLPWASDAKTLRMWRRNRRAIYLMLYAGLRIHEVAALRWGDIDSDAAVLTVRHGKGDVGRDVPISAALHAELALVPINARNGAVCGHKNGLCITEKSLGHVFERWLPEQLISFGYDWPTHGTGITAHRLRHSCAWLMWTRGVDIERIRQVLGHRSIETTRIYLGDDPEGCRDAVNAIPPPPTAPPHLRLIRYTGTT